MIDWNSKDGGKHKYAICNTDGFSLLETLLVVWMMAAGLAIAVPIGVRWLDRADLESTTYTLVYNLRYVQQYGQNQGSYGAVRMSRFTPDYDLMIGSVVVGKASFDAGVNYSEGYLQLNSPRIEYDLLGNSPNGGVIRLTDGHDEQDITLYLNSGLQVVMP